MTLYTDLVAPNSTAIKKLYYNRNSRELYVEFHNGQLAGYDNIPMATWENFTNGDSVGRFYNRNIYDRFAGINTDGINLVYAYSDEAAETELTPEVDPMETVQWQGTADYATDNVTLGDPPVTGTYAANTTNVSLDAPSNDSIERIVDPYASGSGVTPTSNKYVISYELVIEDDFSSHASNEEEALIAFNLAMNGRKTKVQAITRYF